MLLNAKRIHALRRILVLVVFYYLWRTRLASGCCYNDGYWYRHYWGAVRYPGEVVRPQISLETDSILLAS